MPGEDQKSDFLPTNSVPAASSGQFRLGLLLVCVVLGFVIGYRLFLPVETTLPGQSLVKNGLKPLPTGPLPDRPQNLLMPAVDLSPREVVEKQLAALTAYRNDRVAIHQVFAYASAENRTVTGPLSKFEKMIRSQPYSHLIVSKYCMVGQPVISGDAAAVLVTTVDPQGQLSVFRFLLSQQTEADPNSECWMTDAVFCLVTDWRPSEAVPAFESTPLDQI